jgi:hypothetical protein
MACEMAGQHVRVVAPETLIEMALLKRSTATSSKGAVSLPVQSVTVRTSGLGVGVAAAGRGSSPLRGGSN